MDKNNLPVKKTELTPVDATTSYVGFAPKDKNKSAELKNLGVELNEFCRVHNIDYKYSGFLMGLFEKHKNQELTTLQQANAELEKQNAELVKLLVEARANISKAMNEERIIDFDKFLDRCDKLTNNG